MISLACGQWSGGRGGVSGWSQVAGCLPDDLQGHGGTGELGQGVGQGAGGCPQLPQVGYGVYHAAQEEDQEVHPGDEGVRPQEGVDEAQEQEGVNGLHVIPMGPKAAFHVWVAPAVLEASVSLSILGVGKSLLPKPHLARDDGHYVHLDDQQRAAEQEGRENLAAHHLQAGGWHLGEESRGSSSGEDSGGQRGRVAKSPSAGRGGES